MSGFPWLDFLWSEHSIYLWGSYIVALGLIVVEVAMVDLRQRTILGHLGWSSAELPSEPAPGAAGQERR